jgi:hypothetical protein
LDVVYFHQYFATRRRSTGTRSYELARRLVERGHRVTIVSRDTRRLEAGREERPQGRLVAREQIDGIDVLFLNVPYANRYPPPVRLASFTAFTVAAGVAGMLERRPDIVFASSTPLTIGIAGLATARLKRVPFVFEVRDLWPAVPIELGVLRNRPAVWSAEWLERRLYESAARVVVLSEGAQQDLERRGIPYTGVLYAGLILALDGQGRPVIVLHGGLSSVASRFARIAAVTTSRTTSSSSKWAMPYIPSCEAATTVGYTF